MVRRNEFLSVATSFEARQAEKEGEKDRASVLRDLKDKQRDIPLVTKDIVSKNKADMEL